MHVKDGGGIDITRSDEKWSDSAYILVVELARFDNRMNAGCKRKRTVKNDNKVSSLNNLKNSVSICTDESEYRKSSFTVKGYIIQ